MIRKIYKFNKIRITVYLKNRNKNISVQNYFSSNIILNKNIFSHFHIRGNKYFPKVKLNKEKNYLFKIEFENFNRGGNNYIKKILPTVFDRTIIKKLNIRNSLLQLKNEWIDDVNFLLSSEKKIDFSSFEENCDFLREDGESSESEELMDFPIIY